MHKRFALRFGTVLALVLLAAARPSVAAKPEDVFKGKIIITKNRLPMRFSSSGALRQRAAEEQDRQDLADRRERRRQGELEPRVPGVLRAAARRQRDPGEVLRHHPRAARSSSPAIRSTRASAARASSAPASQLAKPEFDVRKRYMMTIESRGRVIATTSFWLLGKGANYSGKVEFSDSERAAVSEATLPVRAPRVSVECAALALAVVCALAARLRRPGPRARAGTRRRRRKTGASAAPRRAGPAGRRDRIAAPRADRRGRRGRHRRGRQAGGGREKPGETEPLLEVLAEGGRAVRVQAVLDALAKLGDARVLRRTRRSSTRWTLYAGHRAPDIRRRAVKALGQPAGCAGDDHPGRAAGRRGARRSGGGG